MKYCTFLLLLFAPVFASAQTLKVENYQLVLDKPVGFKTGTSEILKESETVLQSVKQYLTDKLYVSTMRIEGHVADGIKNQLLSEQRALVVAQWLTKNGIDCKRLIAVGFGDTKPIVATDATNKSVNTRIVFAIAALRNHAIGGMPVDGGGKAAGEPCQ